MRNEIQKEMLLTTFNFYKKCLKEGFGGLTLFISSTKPFLFE